MSTHAADFVGTTHWRLDPERSKIEFHVPTMWGLATVKGRFTRFHGQLEGSDVELTVEADSIDTATSGATSTSARPTSWTPRGIRTSGSRA